MPVLRGLIYAFEERLTPGGRYVLLATAAFALIGVDTRRTHAFVLFSAGAAAVLLALLALRFRCPPVRLDCRLPERLTALVPREVVARVFAERPLGSELVVSFPHPRRWASSLAWEPRQAFARPDQSGAAETRVTVKALRRGRYELPAPTVRLTDPWRLAGSRPVSSRGQTLLVYPRFYRIEEFPVPEGRRYQPGGIPLSSKTGDAIEFVGTREYRQGDPLRTIHWRSWARRGEPVVKEYQEEYFCRIALVLDTFLPAKPRAADIAGFEAAISVLASLTDHFGRGEHVVDILAAGPDLYEVSAGRSLAYLENVLDVLACLEPCPRPPFETVGPHLAEKLSRITTVVAVLLDWDQAREAFLRQVQAQGAAVRAIVVREGPTQLDWRRAGEELGEVSLMTPTDVERALAASASEPKVAFG